MKSFSTDPQETITEWLTLLRECARDSNPYVRGYAYAGAGDFMLQHGAW